MRLLGICAGMRLSFRLFIPRMISRPRPEEKHVHLVARLPQHGTGMCLEDELAEAGCAALLGRFRRVAAAGGAALLGRFRGVAAAGGAALLGRVRGVAAEGRFRIGARDGFFLSFARDRRTAARILRRSSAAESLASNFA